MAEGGPAAPQWRCFLRCCPCCFSSLQPPPRPSHGFCGLLSEEDSRISVASVFVFPVLHMCLCSCLLGTPVLPETRTWCARAEFSTVPLGSSLCPQVLPEALPASSDRDIVCVPCLSGSSPPSQSDGYPSLPGSLPAVPLTVAYHHSLPIRALSMPLLC